ncbi:MAG TPA: MarR family transcriptional regulator [Segeticoccus sp.]|nr:MarR family transcriptional regulator [Segeticoccus sp.]
MSRPDDVTRLYLTLGRINRALRRDARNAPIGHGALSALATLAASEPIRLGELADLEGVSAASMSRIIASLEKLGMVRREADPEDRRAFLVEPTSDGRRVVEAGRAARMQALAARLEKLSREERDDLRRALPALEALVG